MAVTANGYDYKGYDHRHKVERAKWQRRIDRGETFDCSCAHVDCTKHVGPCTVVIHADMTWDLGHTDDRTAWTGPECVPCNRSAGGKNGNRVARDNAATIRRDW